MVKGIPDIITPPTKIKKTVYAQTYTRINTYYLYLLLILISIILTMSGFFIALRNTFAIVSSMFSKTISIDFIGKINIINNVYIYKHLMYE